MRVMHIPEETLIRINSAKPCEQISNITFIIPFSTFFFSRPPDLRGLRELHPAEVREPEQAQGHEGGVHALHVRHRHQQHRVRLRRRHGRHHQEQPQGLRTVLKLLQSVKK